MTGTEVRLWITLVLAVIAAASACRGWLMDVPDGSGRYKCRLMTFLALEVAATVWLGRDIAGHAWWLVAMDAMTLWLAWDYIGKNWRLLEASRKAERARAWLKESQ